jgi:2-hydroxy-3-keto-5-methylthiopentenyl-1-phosphate phosphatase
MNTKLTLSLEKEVIEQAKSYAKKTGRSLSELVESYFKNLTEKIDKEDEIHPKIKKLIGIITLPDDFDENKARDEYYKEKYGL